ncbi:MAG: protein translocase subunit SecD [bacterium]
MNIRKKIWLTLIGIVVLAILAGMVNWPGEELPFFNKFKTHLGLDLQGGTHLVYQADITNVEENEIDDSLAGVRDVIENRVNAFGVAEPVIQTNKTEGNYRVIIELAGVQDVNEAINMIGQTPTLDFRELSDTQYTVEDFTDADGNQLLTEDQLPPKFDITALTGQHLQKATLQFDQNTNQPIVGLQFDNEGKDIFAELTKKNLGKPLAIYLDGQQISVPTVQSEITSGEAIISGNFDIEEARTLARRLNAGALPVPIELISQQTVGASLGAESIDKSLYAGIIGLILVSIFMLIYYRLPGLLSVFALIIYGLILFALVKMIPITLTLAGIAGFILSVGMAVDANVLIFERMKEELKEGKTLGAAIEEGFNHAWKSIRDSNISTLITCFILFWFGTSIVKGFALTLGIGVLISMFSAITVSRTLLRVFIGTRIGNSKFLFSAPKAEVKEE